MTVHSIIFTSGITMWIAGLYEAISHAKETVNHSKIYHNSKLLSWIDDVVFTQLVEDIQVIPLVWRPTNQKPLMF